MYKTLLIFFLIQAPFFCFPQDVGNLADSLKENASVVKQNYHLQMEIKDLDKVIYTVKQTITVLRGEGDSKASLHVFYDDSRKVKDVDGRLYDAEGNEMRKFRSDDIRDVSVMSEGTFFSDSRAKVAVPNAKSYPYTVKYEYEVKMKDVFDIPDWMPVGHFGESVEKATLEVINESDTRLKFKPVNISDESGIEFHKEEDNKLKATLKGIKAVEDKSYSSSLFESVPYIRLALEDFEYDGYRGSLKSWREMGLWHKKLQKVRDDLPADSRKTIKQLTSGLESKRSKVKAVYKYMQNHCRYVSIQLGIGGWQPFEASYVDKKKYGDCKALSFYMKSLLEVINIPSYYTLVYGGNPPRKVDTAFPANQFNHVILTVPLKNDTIWLECTNMQQPFDYLGSFTHDRSALMITPKGGKLIRTPSYPEVKNVLKRVGNFQIEKNGTISGQIKTQCSGLRYDLLENSLEKSESELKKEFHKEAPFSGFTIDKIDVEADKSVPSIKRTISLEVENYASKTGKRLFLQPNLMNIFLKNFKGDDRRQSMFSLNVPYFDKDSIRYKIPKGYKIEHMPEGRVKESKYGNYEIQFLQEDGYLVFFRRFKRTKEKYPPEETQEFASFRNFVSGADKEKIVLVEE